jgi:hypothetical protein
MQNEMYARSKEYADELKSKLSKLNDIKKIGFVHPVKAEVYQETRKDVSTKSNDYIDSVIDSMLFDYLSANYPVYDSDLHKKTEDKDADRFIFLYACIEEALQRYDNWIANGGRMVKAEDIIPLTQPKYKGEPYVDPNYNLIMTKMPSEFGFNDDNDWNDMLKNVDIPDEIPVADIKRVSESIIAGRYDDPKEKRNDLLLYYLLSNAGKIIPPAINVVLPEKKEKQKKGVNWWLIALTIAIIVLIFVTIVGIIRLIIGLVIWLKSTHRSIFMIPAGPFAVLLLHSTR